VEIFMVSHRWLRPVLDRTQAHPDRPDNDKARAIHQFSLWRRQWVRQRHGFWPEIFYWIDYCCIDQTNTAPAVLLLPLWVACCERFLRIETDDYNDRTWCRLEPLLSYVFSFADHHVSIDPDFQCRWPYFGNEIHAVLHDPLTGLLTNAEDMRLIGPLVQLSTTLRATNPNRAKVCLGQTTVKCYKL
jgi:hypothetical protein